MSRSETWHKFSWEETQCKIMSWCVSNVYCKMGGPAHIFIFKGISSPRYPAQRGWRGFREHLYKKFCVTTGARQCETGTAFLQWLPTVMYLEHKEEEITLPYSKTPFFVSIFLPSIAVQRQQLRTLYCAATIILIPSGTFWNSGHCSKQIQLSGALRRNPNKKNLFTWPTVFTVQLIHSEMRRGGGGWRVGWALSVLFSITVVITEEPNTLEFTFTVARVCHLHSDVILVFLQHKEEQSREHVVYHEIVSRL